MFVGKASATAAIDCFSMWCNNAFEITEMLLLEGGCCGHSLKTRGLAVTRGTNLTSSLYLINCTPLDKKSVSLMIITAVANYTVITTSGTLIVIIIKATNNQLHK